MVTINWTFNALEDLASIAEYSALKSPRYAEIIVDKLLFATDILLKFPEIGRIVPEFGHSSIREIIHNPYRIVYKIISTVQIDIITVHHASRPFDV